MTAAIETGPVANSDDKKRALDVWVTRTVKDKSGQIIHTDRFYSHYARMVGLILIGKAAS
jgi:hypothetical protein